MARKGGNPNISEEARKAGVQFSSDNQPSSKLKSDGWKRKRELKEIANSLITGEGLKAAQLVASKLGVELDEDEFTLEMVIMLKQIEKAALKGDTKAFVAVMDRLKGKPRQTISTSMENLDPPIANLPLVEYNSNDE